MTSERRCCLCGDNLDCCKGKSRQKRLSSCTQAEREKLQECALESCNVSLSDFPHFGDQSILCYQCLQKLNKLIKYQKEINEVKDQISLLFHQLNVPATSHTIRKRMQAEPPKTPQPKKSKHQYSRRICFAPRRASSPNVGLISPIVASYTDSPNVDSSNITPTIDLSNVVSPNVAVCKIYKIFIVRKFIVFLHR